jgi:hypothetical protein
MLKTNQKTAAIIITATILATTAAADLEFRDPEDVKFYTGIQMKNSHTIQGLPNNPPTSSSAISKQHVQTNYLGLNGDVMKGNLDMNGNKIQNLPTPSKPGEPATKDYVDTELKDAAGSQNLSQVLEQGQKANQTLNMNQHQVTGVADPTKSFDAVNRQYLLEKTISSQGDTINGTLDMLNHDIINTRKIGIGTPKPDAPVDIRSTVNASSEDYWNKAAIRINNELESNTQGTAIAIEDEAGGGAHAQGGIIMEGSDPASGGNHLWITNRLDHKNQLYIDNTENVNIGRGNLDMNGNNITTSGGETCAGRFC